MQRTAAHGPLSRVLRTITDREWKADVVVFLGYFATAKLAQYILYTLDTSPALIWAPAGIAIAAVLLKGNRMWVPIALAHVGSILTLSIDVPLTNLAFSTVGHTVQPLIGAWILLSTGSDGSVQRTRDVVTIVGFSFVIAAIAPIISTVGQVYFDTLRDSAWLNFSRTWAGGVFGIVIFTPFITAWSSARSWPIKRNQRAEAVAAFGLLILSIYALFWISIPSLVFAFIFLLCITHIWIAFRFDARMNTSALMILSVLGILGSIVASPGDTPLARQIFADELFIILLAPIFLQFFVLAEERRQAELHLNTKVSELEEITKQLAANDSAKNEFIAILAHELRNPLATVVSTLEVLKMEVTVGQSTAMIARAEQQTFGMRRLLDDLLDVARITERKFDVVPERADLKEIIDHSVNATELLRAHKMQTIRVWLPSEPVPLFVDSLRMEQVIGNLLNNSSKYSPEGTEVEVLATVDGHNLVIAIKDSGVGIPPERLEEIFSPFQQLSLASSRAAGIGIGLFLSRQIVEMHGGTITAHSLGEGRGSTFTILLPIVPVPATVTATPAVNTLTATGTKRILVVDDNEAAAIGMERLLAHHGHMVQTAHDGKSALVALHDFMPQVVLLDIGLPDMSGHEVARKIRSHGGKQPILIALTGYGQDSDKSEAIVSGFNYHLTKPVSITEVLAILNTL
ncbi:MAG: response regulator [Candidatus Pacebacteria bacterium]|nr:response regulator [Candidatus Paceibacterota bacterium]